MNRRQADRLVSLVAAIVLLGGGALTWEAYQQRRATDGMMGSMMDSSMDGVHGPDPLVYVLLTVLLAIVIVGSYAVVRDSLPAEGTTETRAPTGANTADQPPPAEPAATERSDDSGDRLGDTQDSSSPQQSPSPPEAEPRQRVLDLLPDDERRVLEPVIDSPGITQVKLRDRSSFSKSKVSQTVSDLEKRGLLYRERQGRTYRIYPSDELQDPR